MGYVGVRLGVQVWDSGRALELPAVYKGAYAVLGASAITSALLAFL